MVDIVGQIIFTYLYYVLLFVVCLWHERIYNRQTIINIKPYIFCDALPYSCYDSKSASRSKHGK